MLATLYWDGNPLTFTLCEHLYVRSTRGPVEPGDICVIHRCIRCGLATHLTQPHPVSIEAVWVEA
jgi:hypothetical protein